MASPIHVGGVPIVITGGADGQALVYDSTGGPGATPAWVNQDPDAFAFPLLAPDGTAVAPSYSYGNEGGTGGYLNNSVDPTLGLAVEGADAVLIRRLLNDGIGAETGFEFTPTIDKAEAEGAWIGLSVDATITNDDSTALNKLLDLKTGGTTQTEIQSDGRIRTQIGTAAAPGYSFLTADAGMFMIGASLSLGSAGTERMRLGANQMGLAYSGSAAIPAFTFGIGQTRGFFANVANEIGISTNGVERMRWTANEIPFANPLLGADGTAGAPSYSFGTAPNYGMYFASNSLRWAVAGAAEVILDGSQFYPAADKGQTLGVASFRWKDLHIAGQTINAVSHATADEPIFDFQGTVNKAAGDFYGIHLDVTDLTPVGIADRLLRLRSDTGSGMTERFAVKDTGAIRTGGTAGGTATDPALGFATDNLGFYELTSSAIATTVAGANRHIFGTSVFRAANDNDNDLGTTAQKWKDIYGYTLQMDNGTAGAPAIGADSDPDTGIYFAADEILMVAGGTSTRLRVTANIVELGRNTQPTSNGGLNLGAATFRWNNFYTEAMNLADATAAVDDTITWDTFGITYGGSDNDFEIQGTTTIADASGKNWRITGAPGGVASATAGGSGATGTVRSGLGGAGTAGLAAGDGGPLNLTARDAGPDNGGGGADGGTVILTAGLATGAGLAGQINIARAGTAARPTLIFNGDVDSGFYQQVANQVAVATSGAVRMAWTATEVQCNALLRPNADSAYDLGTTTQKWRDGFIDRILADDGLVSAPSYSWDNAQTSGMWLAAANTPAFSAAGSVIFHLLPGGSLEMQSGREILVDPGSEAGPGIAFRGSSTTGFSLAGSMRVSLGGVAYYTISTGSISPKTDGAVDIGSPTTRFGRVFSGAGTAALPAIVVANGTTDSDNGLFAAATDTVSMALAGVEEYVFTAVAFSPFADDANDLGSNVLNWRRLYVGPGAAASPSVTISTNGNGFWAPAVDQIGVSINDVSEFLFTATSFESFADGANSLGLLTKRFDNVFSEKYTLKSHLNYSGSEEVKFTAVTQTTNATQKTLWSMSLADETVYRIEAKLVARDTAGTSVERGAWGQVVCVYREAAANATIQGAVGDTHDPIESTGTMDVTFTVSGTTVQLSVTGVAATDIEWVAVISYHAVSTV